MTSTSPTSTTTHLADGEMPGHLWLPDQGAGPGVLLLQEIFGVSNYIQRRGRALADAGYVVLAPELYWRLPQRTVDETADDAVQQAMGLAGQLDWTTTVADAVAAFADLSEREAVTGTPGVLGFCFGGGLAFHVAAVTEPAVLVAYYGSALPGMGELAPDVTCPALHHLGTADAYLDLEQVRRVAEAASGPTRFETYEGADHAFDNDDFVNHHPDASARAWETTLAFLGEHLR